MKICPAKDRSETAKIWPRTLYDIWRNTVSGLITLLNIFIAINKILTTYNYKTIKVTANSKFLKNEIIVT